MIVGNKKWTVLTSCLHRCDTNDYVAAVTQIIFTWRHQVLKSKEPSTCLFSLRTSLRMTLMFEFIAWQQGSKRFPGSVFRCFARNKLTSSRGDPEVRKKPTWTFPSGIFGVMESSPGSNLFQIGFHDNRLNESGIRKKILVSHLQNHLTLVPNHKNKWSSNTIIHRFSFSIGPIHTDWYTRGSVAWQMRDSNVSERGLGVARRQLQQWVLIPHFEPDLSSFRCLVIRPFFLQWRLKLYFVVLLWIWRELEGTMQAIKCVVVGDGYARHFDYTNSQ